MNRIILTLLLVIGLSISAVADDVKQDIIQKCREMVGKYGAAVVKSCADQDIKALTTLNQYPDKYKSIIDRCFRQTGKYGYAVVKSCVDQDIKAEKALSNY